MMKFLLGAMALLSALAAGCESEDSIFTQLSVRLVMPDTRPVDRLVIVSESSYFRNVNTDERIAFPQVVDNKAALRLRKGVYTLIVEAEATYGSNEVKLLRNADYNQNGQALTWIGENESIVLLLKTVN